MLTYSVGYLTCASCTGLRLALRALRQAYIRLIRPYTLLNNKAWMPILPNNTIENCFCLHVYTCAVLSCFAKLPHLRTYLASRPLVHRCVYTQRMPISKLTTLSFAPMSSFFVTRPLCSTQGDTSSNRFQRVTLPTYQARHKRIDKGGCAQL